MDEALNSRASLATGSSSSGDAGGHSHSAGPSGSGSASGSAAAANHQLSKRKRGLGIVTPNACTECRKKRAKCDGHRPCGRCKIQKDVDCVYEVPVRQSKEHLRSEIEHLRHRKQSSDQVFAALVRPDLWEDVMERLRSGQSVEVISDWVRANLSSGGGARSNVGRAGESGSDAGTKLPPMARFAGGSSSATLVTMGLGSQAGLPMSPNSGQQSGIRQDIDESSPWHVSSQSHSTRSGSHPDLMNWTADVGAPPQSRVGSWADSMNADQSSDGGSRYRGVDQVLASLANPEIKVPAGTWTNITGDSSLVQHLLALYFCWEYPTFASLSKEHFLKDFETGRPRYCSPILVNALLALGCRFSSQPTTRANPNDPYTSGDHFFKECQRLFYLEDDHHCLTTIQALGIMSIREASCGRDSESWYYAGQSIRLAIEMGLHRVRDEGDEDELAVQAATFWGAFALDHAWSLATGSLPQCSCFPHLPPRPAIIDDIEASLWIPYTDDGAPLQRSCEQPSNVHSVYKCFCELSELVHQSLYILHSPGRPLTSRDLLNIYTQYLNWYDRIPEVLRLGHNFTPAVLFAHMYYHFAILLLFRPLIKLRIIGSNVSPRDVCLQAAEAIQGLLRSYSQLYTLRRTPSFVPYFVLTSSIMHLAISAASPRAQQQSKETSKSPEEVAAKRDPRVAESIAQGISDLSEMAPCHHFAEQALNILRYLAKKWNIDVEIDHGKGATDDNEQLGRPYASSLNFFAPNVREDDYMCAWGGGPAPASTATLAKAENTPASVAQSATSLENPLFWPFPMQGRPILARGHELEEAGFAMAVT